MYIQLNKFKNIYNDKFSALIYKFAKCIAIDIIYVIVHHSKNTFNLANIINTLHSIPLGLNILGHIGIGLGNGCSPYHHVGKRQHKWIPIHILVEVR